MKEQEFNDLIQAIENGTFVGDSITISIDPFDEDRNEERLDDAKTIRLANALKKNPSITKLDLSCNNIEDDGAIALSSIPTLEALTLYGNLIGPIGATALANSKCKILSLQGNPINFRETESQQFREMIQAFVRNTTITNLNLNNCYINDELINILIKQNSTIKTLILSDFLTDNALINIQNNKKLEYLYLPNSQITDKGAQYLSQNTSLKDLGISDSHITDVGAQILSTHSTLKKLFLNDSDITIRGAQSFIGCNIDKVSFRSNLKQHIMSKEEICTFDLTFEKGKFLRDHPEMTFILDNENHQEAFGLDNIGQNHVDLSGDLNNSNDAAS